MKDEIKIIENDIAAKQDELTAILKEMTGLNETADQYIEKRNSLRLKKEELQEALIALGYKDKEIKKVIGHIDDSKSIEEQIKEALKLLLR